MLSEEGGSRKEFLSFHSILLDHPTSSLTKTDYCIPFTIIAQSFEHFINLNNKSPEKISLFIDSTLRKGMKGMTEEEVDNLLDQVMMLFRFIQEKDIFEKYYKQHLAKRLLVGKCISDDTERNMIGKLKLECGYQFTSKLEGMFNDMRISADTMEGFRDYLKLHHEITLNGIDFNVQVLTTGFWPTQQVASCNLPTKIAHCCQVFKQFYFGNHNGRKITWQTNMGIFRSSPEVPARTFIPKTNFNFFFFF